MIRTAVMYAYCEACSDHVRNFQYFVTHGMQCPNTHYVVIVNGTASHPMPDAGPFVTVVRRENKGFDFGAWAAGLASLQVGDYGRFVFLNGSCCGPFLTAGTPTTAWVDVFCSRLSGNIHVVGPTINIYKRLPLCRPHVQTYAWAATATCVQMLLESGIFAFVGFTKDAVIEHQEVGVSTLVLKKGWEIGCFVPEFNAIKSYQPSNEAQLRSFNPSADKYLGDMMFPKPLCFGRELQPTEVMFIKTNRGHTSFQHLLQTSELKFLDATMDAIEIAVSNASFGDTSNGSLSRKKSVSDKNKATSAMIASVPPIQASENGFIVLAGRAADNSFVTGSQGFVVRQILFPVAETVIPDPASAKFPAVSNMGSGSAQTPTAPVLWLLAPGVHTIQATIAWTSEPVSESTLVTGVPNPAESTPHVVQTMLTTSLADNSTMSSASHDFSQTQTTVTSSPASMENVTPYLMPTGPRGIRHIDNFITQSVSSTVTVPPGSFLAFRLTGMASKYFPRPVVPVLYELSVSSAPAAPAAPALMGGVLHVAQRPANALAHTHTALANVGSTALAPASALASSSDAFLATTTVFSVVLAFCVASVIALFVLRAQQRQ